MSEVDKILSEEQPAEQPVEQSGESYSEWLKSGRDEIVGGSGEAAFRGLMRGFTGPLADVYARATGTENLLAAQKEAHPLASGAGEFAGFVGGALTGTGLGGMLTRGGSAFGKKALEKTGNKFIASGTRGAVEGVGIGVTEGTTKSALDAHLDMPGAAAQVMQAGGIGLAMGGVTSLFGTGLHKTASWFFKKGAKKQLEKQSTLMASRLSENNRHQAIIKDLEALEMAGQKGTEKWNRLIGNVDDLEGKIGRDSSMGRAKLFHGMYEQGPVPSKLLDNIRKMNNLDGSIKSLKDNTLKQMAKEGGAASRRIGDMAIATVSAFGLGTFGAATPLVARYIMPGLAESIGSKILRGASKLKSVNKLVGKTLQNKGDLTLDIIKASNGRFIREPNKAAVTAGRLIRTLRVPPIRGMSNMDFMGISEELESVDMAEYEMSVRSALASSGVPQELANAHIDSQMRAVEYLRQMSPAKPSSNWVSDTSYTPNIPQEERLKFARRVRAAMAPTSFINDFLEGSLTREASDTFHNLHPEMAQELSEMAMNDVQIALTHGKKFSPKEQRQIALFIGEYKKLGGANSPDVVQFLQGMYQKAREQDQAQQGRAAQPGSGAPTGLNNNYLTESQRLQKGI